MLQADAPEADGRGCAGGARSRVEQALARYGQITALALRDSIPTDGPRYLWDLVGIYPDRGGKALRPALCFASCSALGGSERRAVRSAVAIELFHNAFLVHDDIQDESMSRRGASTLHRQFGIGVAVNVGNATNLLGLRSLVENRRLLGPDVSWRVFEETQTMMGHALEGQAMEVGWIRDNVFELTPQDYLRMCLKKTSWYSFVYPLSVGALVARGAHDPEPMRRFGWFLGAAFQIQDDVLNLVGDFGQYGKEIGGDLWEGKRTLMLIHLFSRCSATERRLLKRIYAKRRRNRTESDIEKVHELVLSYGSIDFARRTAKQLAGAALLEGLALARDWPESVHKAFILDMALWVATRTH